MTLRDHRHVPHDPADQHVAAAMILALASVAIGLYFMVYAGPALPFGPAEPEFERLVG